METRRRPGDWQGDFFKVLAGSDRLAIQGSSIGAFQRARAEGFVQSTAWILRKKLPQPNGGICKPL